MRKKNLADYRTLPYTRRCMLAREGDTFFWHAWVEELPGCEVDGETKAEAFALLAEVFDDYIDAKLEWQSVIPEPGRWPHFGEADSRVAHGNTTIEILGVKKTPNALPSFGDDGAMQQSIDTFEAVGAIV